MTSLEAVTTVPFLQVKLKVVVSCRGGVSIWPEVPVTESPGPVKVQEVALVVDHLMVQALPLSVKAFRVLRVISGLGQEESGGAVAKQEPSQRYLAASVCPQEFTPETQFVPFKSEQACSASFWHWPSVVQAKPTSQYLSGKPTD